MTAYSPHTPLRAGLLGARLGHSHSPGIHRALSGGRYTYTLFEREPTLLEAFLREDPDWDAINVTIPYKQAVMPYLDDISPEAARIGAVNTVIRRPDGRLYGDNTDYAGFLYTLRTAACPIAGQKALVLGNGGAAATAVAALTDLGARVTVLGKSPRPVGGLTPAPYETAYTHHADATLVVNCTPVGMYPDLVGQKLLELSRLPQLTAVFDMVYNPARTALLQEANALGIPAYNGLPMLVAQAARACELFLNTTLPDGCIEPILADITRQTQNIILIGMPGCGKSTVGALLAARLHRPLADTDRLLAEAAGRSIPTILAEEGEAAFRALETEVVQRVGQQSGCVIATGGGVVTRPENLPLLSQNGIIIYLHRDPTQLPTDGRPLSRATPPTELYRRRAPLYRAFADIEIDNNQEPAAAVAAILQKLGYDPECEVTP